MAKELYCPHCKKPQHELHHDEHLNLLCFNCQKIIFGVTEEADSSLKRITFSYFKKEPLPIRVSSSCCVDEDVNDDLMELACFA